MTGCEVVRKVRLRILGGNAGYSVHVIDDLRTRNAIYYTQCCTQFHICFACSSK